MSSPIPQFTIIPNDWIGVQQAFNDLCTLIAGVVDEDVNLSDYILKDGTRAFTGTGAGFKDEDAMTSDSAVAVASQQSIKAFVNNKIYYDADYKAAIFTQD